MDEDCPCNVMLPLFSVGHVSWLGKAPMEVTHCDVEARDVHSPHKIIGMEGKTRQGG